MSYQIFFKFCIAFVFLSPTLVVGDCTVEVKHATWHYTNGSDEKIPGVPTVEECQDHCLKNPVNCRGYTHTTNGVEGFCYLFKELTGMRECSTCSSGTTPEYFEGACPFNTEDEIGEENTESAQACWQKCFDTNGCSSFTWYDSSTPFENICFLFSRCKDVKVCSGCHSGRVNCISTPQCFEYSVLDEDTRNEHSRTEEGVFKYYDETNVAGQSPRWVGPSYYRLLPPAGLVIPERGISCYHCGAHFGGFLLTGSHPETVGVEKHSVIHYSETDNTKNITITLCPGAYYVYYLPTSSNGVTGRYCGALEI